jgi:hypothetical protein
LKGVLGELKRALERQAGLERRADEQGKVYEEKALSLAALYNDRVERLLGSAKAFTDPQASESVLDEILRLTRRRTAALEAVDALRLGLRRPGDGVARGGAAPLPDLAALPVKDRQNLNLARGLLLDRRSEIQERLDRFQLEEDEILRQLDLQQRMRELLEDPSRPAGMDETRRRGLERLTGRRERERWENRLLELRRKREKDQVNLLQVEHHLENIEYRLKRMGRGKGGAR